MKSVRAAHIGYTWSDYTDSGHFSRYRKLVVSGKDDHWD